MSYANPRKITAADNQSVEAATEIYRRPRLLPPPKNKVAEQKLIEEQRYFGGRKRYLWRTCRPNGDRRMESGEKPMIAPAEGLEQRNAIDAPTIQSEFSETWSVAAKNPQLLVADVVKAGRRAFRPRTHLRICCAELNSVIDLESHFGSATELPRYWTPEFECRIDSVLRSISVWRVEGNPPQTLLGSFPLLGCSKLLYESWFYEAIGV
nr:F-box protein SKIP1-like [Ipomoea batatas]